MSVTIDLQNASGSRDIPLRRQFQHWARTAMNGLGTESGRSQLSIRIIDEAESAELNSHYRSKQGPTNILSFPVTQSVAAGRLLGDLAICAPVVLREASEQHKAPDAHWAHLVVHGVLHLKGYDHERPQDAREMEALEISILEQLGYPNPYQA